MSKVARFSLVCLAALLMTGFVFRAQIWSFLFDPEGLSLAASEFCLSNDGATGLVADLQVEGGARSITWLEPAESACSASPANGLTTVVRVSLVEGEPPFCRYQGKAGQRLKLVSFAPPDQCEWAVQ